MTADNSRRAYHRWDGGDTRRCARCGDVKPIEAFRSQNGRPRAYCIPCGNAVNQEWRARHHDELLARRRAAYSPISNGVYAERQQSWPSHPLREGETQ
jgi:hypothetical protein